ncbi:hypothetical protein SAMN04487995_6028 [Dyadobacter koreensis]|uniref:Apea-like HEPN domain-containing protein n=1 Tax=Dyadobacter koreensis TaxID=408657 RepID=A0A1H7B947_9BACT|nr:methylamine utilization protein MauJ [Dyadobacter koreensis]SEJ70992.1 hypothetical protein SAMN04487995_6028 [Dyadobacter koreensis]
MRIFRVELSIFGQIAIQRPISFNFQKELDFGSVFQSDIKIIQHAKGVKISSTVNTADQERAYKVALLFVGKMLDVLALKTNTALVVSNIDLRLAEENNAVRAIIDEDEFRCSFLLPQTLNLHETTFFKGLNWYRKGLYTEDPFDRFLAFWNSISIVAGKYHTPDDRTRAGIINQIWSCFTLLWGDNNNWNFVNGDDRWINLNNDIRTNIAHALIPVEIQHVEDLINKLDTLQKVAYSFLTQWANKRLNQPLL